MLFLSIWKSLKNNIRMREGILLQNKLNLESLIILKKENQANDYFIYKIKFYIFI
jgi:hypothetical protein